MPHHHFSLSPLEETRSPHLGRTDLIGGIQRELISTLSGLSRVNPLSLSSQAKYLCFGTDWRNLEFAPVPRQRIMGDYFWDMTSLCGPGWSQTGGAPDPPSTASSWVLEEQAGVATPMLTFYAGKLFNHANKNPPFPRATKSDNHLLGIGPLLISDAVSAPFYSLIGGWVRTGPLLKHTLGIHGFTFPAFSCYWALCTLVYWLHISHTQYGLAFLAVLTISFTVQKPSFLSGLFRKLRDNTHSAQNDTWHTGSITKAAHTTWNRVLRINLAFVNIRKML